MGIKILQNNFTTGAISPQVQARVDLAKYEGACKKIKNAIVMPQGGVTKRYGTKMVKKSDRGDGILIPFVYSRTQSYALLFSHHYIHFFKNGHAVAKEGSGVGYYVVTPYSIDDLPQLKFVQSADIMYLTHPNYAPRMLCRYGDTSWDLKEVQFTPGIQPPTNIEGLALAFVVKSFVFCFFNF